MTNQEIGQQVATTFADAFTALAKLPDVEKELRYYKTQFDFKNTDIDRLMADNAAITAKLAEKEAELARATKSAEGLKDNFTFLLGEARVMLRDLTEAINMADPPVAPPPTTEPVGKVEVVSGDLTIAEIEGWKRLTDHDTANAIIDLPNPIPPKESSITDAIMAWKPLADEPHWRTEIPNDPFVPATVPDGSEPTSPAGPSPTSSETSTFDVETPPYVKALPEGRYVPSDSNEPKKNYWLKPSNMSWKDWGAANGDVPYWASDEGLGYVT
jgi:hypothetical protein